MLLGSQQAKVKAAEHDIIFGFPKVTTEGSNKGWPLGSLLPLGGRQGPKLATAALCGPVCRGQTVPLAVVHGVVKSSPPTHRQSPQYAAGLTILKYGTRLGRRL